MDLPLACYNEELGEILTLHFFNLLMIIRNKSAHSITKHKNYYLLVKLLLLYSKINC